MDIHTVITHISIHPTITTMIMVTDMIMGMGTVINIRTTSLQKLMGRESTSISTVTAEKNIDTDPKKFIVMKYTIMDLKRFIIMGPKRFIVMGPKRFIVMDHLTKRKTFFKIILKTQSKCNQRKLVHSRVN
jgi:hypothetical protein